MKRIARKRVFEIIQIGVDSDIASRTFDFLIVGLVIANIFLSVCYTFDELRDYYYIFNALEIITVVFFTVELALRLWTADYLYGRSRIASALRYLVSFSGIIELLSIFPFYLPLLFPKGLIAFRIFRVARILRLFQANAYSDATSAIMIVIKRKRILILSSMLIIFVIMTMASLVMYEFEHDAQPDVFENAFSGMWWATATLLTVGYGDIYPITTIGRIASIVITFLGVGMVAIPTGILSAGFIEYSADTKPRTCPHCGKTYGQDAERAAIGAPNAQDDSKR